MRCAHDMAWRVAICCHVKRGQKKETGAMHTITPAKKPAGPNACSGGKLGNAGWREETTRHAFGPPVRAGALAGNGAAHAACSWRVGGQGLAASINSGQMSPQSVGRRWRRGTPRLRSMATASAGFTDFPHPNAMLLRCAEVVPRSRATASRSRTGTRIHADLNSGYLMPDMLTAKLTTLQVNRQRLVRRRSQPEDRPHETE